MKRSDKLIGSTQLTCPSYESTSVLKFKRLLIKSQKIFEDFLWTSSSFPALPSDLCRVQYHLTLCGNRRIKSLNRRYRHKEKATDVLSFPLYEDLRQKKNRRELWQELHLGDIFIALPIAKRQAKHFDLPLEHEIMYLFIHGFLHLLGFDHEKSLAQEKLMESLEDQLFTKVVKPKARS